MSLILEALGRSQRDEARPLDTLQAAAVDISSREKALWRRWLWPMLLVLALLCIGVLLAERASQTMPPAALAVQKAPVQHAAPPTVAKAEPKIAISVASEPALLAEQIASPAPRQQQAVASLYDDAKSPVNKPSPKAVNKSSPAAIAPDSREKQAGVRHSQESEPLDVEAMVAEAQARLKQQAVTLDHSAPWITDLSQQARDTVPTLYYAQHVYDTVATRRQVTLNGQSLAEGGRVKEVGIKVVEILPDSVVLEYRQLKFRLRALNSWVNL